MAVSPLLLDMRNILCMTNGINHMLSSVSLRQPHVLSLPALAMLCVMTWLGCGCQVSLRL